jgi:hypothetical protein
LQVALSSAIVVAEIKLGEFSASISTLPKVFGATQIASRSESSTRRESESR